MTLRLALKPRLRMTRQTALSADQTRVRLLGMVYHGFPPFPDVSFKELELCAIQRRWTDKLHPCPLYPHIPLWQTPEALETTSKIAHLVSEVAAVLLAVKVCFLAHQTPINRAGEQVLPFEISGLMIDVVDVDSPQVSRIRGQSRRRSYRD